MLLTLCLLGNLACFFFVVCLIFSKLTFSKNYFKNTIRAPNSLDPDQAQHFVGPELVPNCLQRFQLTTPQVGKEMSIMYKIRHLDKHLKYKKTLFIASKCTKITKYKMFGMEWQHWTMRMANHAYINNNINIPY